VIFYIYLCTAKNIAANNMMKGKIFVLFLTLLMISDVNAEGSSAEILSDSVKKSQTVTERVVAWYMNNMNYGTVTLLMAVESSFVPLPSEVVIPPAAYKASQPGSNLNIILVVLFGTLGALIGAVFNYFFALWLGRPVIYRFAESRIGRMCLINKEKVEKAENYFYKHGNISTLIGRLVPVIRQLISLPAGLARMKFGNFVLYTTIGALVWNIILAAIGYVAQGQSDIITQYSRELSYVILILAVLFILYMFYNGFVKKKKN
jgi:membrane protein DedA with SNARE-associated domain